MASGSATVAFLQITEHAFKMQMPNNQIINIYQRARGAQIEATARANVPQRCLEQGFARAVICRNAAPGQAKAIYSIQHLRPGNVAASSSTRDLHPGRQQPHSAEIRRRRRQRWRRQRWRRDRGGVGSSRQLPAALGCEQKGTLKTFWFRGLFSNFAPI